MPPRSDPLVKLSAIAAVLLTLTPRSLDAQSGSVDGATIAGVSYIGTNSRFSILGGFWLLPEAVQTTGAPLRRITPAGPSQATVSGLPGTPGFVLQVNDGLALANWIDAPSGATNPTIVLATFPKQICRLSKPIFPSGSSPRPAAAGAE